jgi:hypothetical protein
MAEAARRDASRRKISNPKEIAEIGQRIYEEKYRAQYERDHPGSFVAINIRTGEASLGPDALQAMTAAKDKDPDGSLHLIRVGQPGAFRVSSSSGNDNRDWFV